MCAHSGALHSHPSDQSAATTIAEQKEMTEENPKRTANNFYFLQKYSLLIASLLIALPFLHPAVIRLFVYPTYTDIQYTKTIFNLHHISSARWNRMTKAFCLLQPFDDT